MNMVRFCNLCFDTISLMSEISGPESEPLEPIYAALHKVVLIEICMWAITNPPDEITGLAECIHDVIHRILLRNVDRILAAAKAEVRKRAQEYGVEEDEVSDWIQDLICTVSLAAGKKL
jgi:hypothetical protein